MVYSILTEETVEVNIEVNDWEEAVRAAGNLLCKNGYAEPRYVDSMVDVVKEVGPYIVLLKGVALAHARPNQGAKKIGLSLVTLKDPINFGNKDNDPVSLVFALSAVDHSSHLELLDELAKIFGDEEGMRELAQTSTKGELLACIDKIVKKTAVL